MTVPAAVPAFTFTTMAKLADEDAARNPFVQVTVPVEPTVKVGVQLQPAVAVRLWNVVLGGTGIVTDTLLAKPGPRFVTTVVNVTLLPALTVEALAVFTTCRSESVETATVVVAEAELLVALSSSVLEETETVSVILVPLGVPVATFTPMVKFAVADAASEVAEHVNVPPEGAVQLHPAAGVTLTKVVLDGIVSVSTGLAASLGPLFVTECVYVMLLFAITGSGESLFVIARSASVITFVTVLAELFDRFGSLVEELILLVVVMLVPFGVFELTFTTNVPDAFVPAGNVAALQVIVPVLPGSSVVQLAPAGAVKETKVVFAGVEMVYTTALAAAGPLLLMLALYVMF